MMTEWVAFNTGDGGAGPDTKSVSLGCFLVPVVRFLRVGFG
jgi:hypothetical protein